MNLNLTSWLTQQRSRGDPKPVPDPVDPVAVVRALKRHDAYTNGHSRLNDPTRFAVPEAEFFESLAAFCGTINDQLDKARRADSATAQAAAVGGIPLEVATFGCDLVGSGQLSRSPARLAARAMAEILWEAGFDMPGGRAGAAQTFQDVLTEYRHNEIDADAATGRVIGAAGRWVGRRD